MQISRARLIHWLGNMNIHACIDFIGFITLQQVSIWAVSKVGSALDICLSGLGWCWDGHCLCSLLRMASSSAKDTCLHHMKCTVSMPTG